MRVWCLGFGSTLVSISATFLSVMQYVTDTMLAAIFLQRKWCQISMCLLHAWKLEFSVKLMVPWLSTLLSVGFLGSSPISEKNFLSQRASLTIWLSAIYSARICLHTRQSYSGLFLGFPSDRSPCIQSSISWDGFSVIRTVSLVSIRINFQVFILDAIGYS